MPSIRITKFAGILPDETSRNIPLVHAQIAHNCLLWDGSLRPMPKWAKFQELQLDQAIGHVYENERNGALLEAVGFEEGVYCTGAPLPDNAVVGINNETSPVTGYSSNLYVTYNPTVNAPLPAGLPTPVFAGASASVPSSSISYQSTSFSQKPVNRIIGMTFVRQTPSGMEESAIGVLPNQAPYGIMFEGDIVQIAMSLDMGLLAQWGVTHVRLYRTVSPLDSGEKAGNLFDTEWHLVDTLPARSTINYNDGGSATTDPLDVLLSARFYPPRFKAISFGVTEGGWFYSASSDGKLAVSERYLSHAWPTENELDLRTTITDTVTHFDNIYIGTHSYPYIVALAPGEGEQGVQVGPTPAPERMACLPGTMVRAATGALYASEKGIVALSREGQRVLTSTVTNPGDILYREKIEATETVPAHMVRVAINKTQKATYVDGKYYGFVNGTTIDDPLLGIVRYGYIYDTGVDIFGAEKYQQLVTIEAPVGHLSQALHTSKGVTLKYTNDLFFLPLPSVVGEPTYRRATKMCYRWKSKKFVFPGQMTLAAGKIVHDCGGAVEIKLYIDCRCVWQASICDCNPFRIPSQLMGQTFEIEVLGKSPIQEIHLASSMQELLEQQ